MDIYVGNINKLIEEEDIERLFSKYGDIYDIRIVRGQGIRSDKVYAFVKMHNSHDARMAIDELDGTRHAGRNLIVKESISKRGVQNNSLRQTDNIADSYNRVDFVQTEDTKREEIEHQACYSKKSQDDGTVRISFK